MQPLTDTEAALSGDRTAVKTAEVAAEFSARLHRAVCRGQAASTALTHFYLLCLHNSYLCLHHQHKYDGDDYGYLQRASVCKEQYIPGMLHVLPCLFSQPLFRGMCCDSHLEVRMVRCREAPCLAQGHMSSSSRVMVWNWAAWPQSLIREHLMYADTVCLVGSISLP